MFIRVKLILRRMRTAETFAAADPWNAGRSTEFRVEVFKLIPEHVTDPRDFREGTLHTLGARDVFGIRSEIDGVERRLPAFLGEAYAAGEIPATRLPLALHGVEARLQSSDFAPLPGPRALRLAALGLAFLVAGGAGLSAVGGARPRPSVAIVSTDAFLARPVSPGEVYAISGLVPLLGRENAPANLAVPESVARSAGGSFFLAWARAGAASRALLLPARNYERGGAVEIGMATVLSPREVGLAPALDALKVKVPDLDTSTVTASRWVNSPSRGPAEAGRIASLLALLVGLGLALGCGLGWASAAPRRRRGRRFLEEIRGLVHGFPGGPAAPR